MSDLQKNSPAQLAAEVYRREPCARTFGEDVEAHLINGYVFSTPTYFAMGRAVDSSASNQLVVNPWHVFPVEQCDAWLVYLVAGDMREAWGRFPYFLPKIGFERKNVLRYYCAESLAEKLGWEVSPLNFSHVSLPRAPFHPRQHVPI